MKECKCCCCSTFTGDVQVTPNRLKFLQCNVEQLFSFGYRRLTGFKIKVLKLQGCFEPQASTSVAAEGGVLFTRRAIISFIKDHVW